MAVTAHRHKRSPASKIDAARSFRGRCKSFTRFARSSIDLSPCWRPASHIAALRYRMPDQLMVLCVDQIAVRRRMPPFGAKPVPQLRLRIAFPLVQCWPLHTTGRTCGELKKPCHLLQFC